jgi:catechol 2,3-dioxygenase
VKDDSIHPAVRVGHIHLMVADLDRAIAFYRDALGLNVVADGRQDGINAAFLAAGDYHHHVGLSTWDIADGTSPPDGHAGLHHVAFLYPDRRELVRAIQRLLHTGHSIHRCTDHGATVSVYLTDADGNGIELYYDRPRAEWSDAEGRPILRAERLDLTDLVPATRR